VIELLALGTTTNEIAAELAISPDTVRAQVQNILVKLQVHSRLDPPPLPPAASAALPFRFSGLWTFQRTSVSVCVERERLAIARSLIDCEEDRTLRAVLVGMLRKIPTLSRGPGGRGRRGSNASGCYLHQRGRCLRADRRGSS